MLELPYGRVVLVGVVRAGAVCVQVGRKFAVVGVIRVMVVSPQQISYGGMY